jgi:putative phosphoesterase
MRVLLLSDTHGHLNEGVLELAGTCELAVHGGDVGAGWILEALSEATGASVTAVRGNNDTSAKWQGSTSELAGLPTEAELELPGGCLAVTHGDAFPARNRHVRLREQYPEARGVIYGHSHRLCVDDEQVPIVVNPGAAGRARTYGGPACLILEADQTDWRFESYRFQWEKKRSR